MENKAKRFLRLLLAIAMVMAIVPMTFALATETNVAQIGEQGYESLAEAIVDANAAEGGATVTLLQDVTLGEMLTISGNVTISGAHTITRADNYTGTLFAVNSGATLTLDGGLTIDGNNEWTFDKASYESDRDNMVQVKKADYVVDGVYQKYITPETGAPAVNAHMITNAGGTVNLNSVTIQNEYGKSAGAVKTTAAGSVVTLNGATITHIASMEGNGVVVHSDQANTIILNDGTVIIGNYVGGNHGLFLLYSGTKMTMNGGEIKDTTGWNSNGVAVGIYGSGSEFTMNGGLICGSSSVWGQDNQRNMSVNVHSGAKMTMNGGTICHNIGKHYAGGIASYKTNNSIIINGGSVIHNISLDNDNRTNPPVERGDDLDTPGPVTITGGTFTQDVSQWVAEGFTCEKRDDGTWGVVEFVPVAEVNGEQYDSLQKAIEAANAIDGGATVTLLQDVILGEKLTISGNVTIFGAHTITRADNYTGTLFAVNKGATLTFEMVTVDGGNNWTFLKDEYEAQVMSGQRVYNDQVRYTVYEEGAPVASSAVVSVSGEVVLDGATFQNHVGATIFSVGSGAKLIMTNAVVDHNTKAGSSVVADIASGATWIINEGTEITNNHNHGGNGTLSYMKGTTIMNGGKICSNSGVDNNGSVFMLYGGAAEFVMNGGTVCHNWALKGTNNGWNCAFYVYGNGSSFVMNNGVIEENVSSILPGVANNGSNASVEINGGKIQNNTSANNNVGTEVYAYCPTTIGEGVVIRDAVAVFNNLTNNGTIDGGMYVGGTATIDGTGTVTGNMRIAGNATITSGTYLGTFNVSGSLTITGGTFAQDVSQWCAEGYACELNDDGTWGVVKQDPLVLVVAGGQNKYFVDLNEALQYAYSCSSTGVSVHILGNLTVTEPIVIRDDDMVKNSVEMRSSDLSKNFTITATGSEFIKMESGTLYIKSLNINAENDAFYVTGGTVELRCYHTVHVTNVTSQKGNCVYIRGGTVNVYGANLTSNGEYPAIQGNGAYAGDVKIGIWQYSTNNATSKITAPNSDMAIYWPGNGKLTIDAGTITGDTALYAKSGTIIINGGEFYGTGDAKAFEHYSNGAYATGDAVVIESCKDAAYETPVVTITGGKFVSDNANAIGVYNCNEAKPMTKFISGGLFSSAPAPEWCAEGMGPKHAKDNMWTVGTGIVTVDGVYFDDWKVAKTYIHGSSVIVLYAAVENEGPFSVGAMYKTVTLDLNGHTFTTTTIGQGNHATLKIVDSAENGSVVVTNYTALYTNGYLDIASDVNFNSYIQINRHSDDQQPSTGCLLIDGVKWIGRGHFKQDDGIIVTTGGYVTIKNNFKDITFNSGNFFLNNTADFAKFAGEQNITVNAGATLDLNGNELTTDSIVCFSELIDTNMERIGGVTVTTDNISWVQKDYMPIYDSSEGYYSLFTYKLNSLGPALNKDGTAAKFGVALCFDKLEAYDLIKNGDGVHSVNLTFVLTIQNKNIYCAYTPEMIAAWAAGAKSHYSQTPAPTTHYALILTVLNLDTMDEGDSLTVTPTVGSYVQTQGAEAPTPIFSAKSVDLTVVKLNNVVTEPTTPAVPANEDEDSGDDGSSEGTSGGDGDPDSQDQ